MISPVEHNGLNIKSIHGPNGLIARSFNGFEARPQQLEMAQAVRNAFQTPCHLAVEAGTGVGKSFAYLVPAIEQVQEKKGKILLSTYTITLQQQLVNKDIPFLADICPQPFTATLAKGRGNYLCKRRLEYAIRRQKGMFDNLAAGLLQINDWSQNTTDGSLSDLQNVPSSALWDAVRSEHGNCRGRKCSHFRDCFYWQARRALETSDIIVANHALLFSDLALKDKQASILPEYHFVIIDEAHNIEHVAEDHFGINITNFTFTYLLNNLYNHRTRKGLLAFINATKAIELRRQCEEAAKIFFTQIQAWYEHTKSEVGLCKFAEVRFHAGFVGSRLAQKGV